MPATDAHRRGPVPDTFPPGYRPRLGDDVAGLGQLCRVLSVARGDSDGPPAPALARTVAEAVRQASDARQAGIDAAVAALAPESREQRRSLTAVGEQAWDDAPAYATAAEAAAALTRQGLPGEALADAAVHCEARRNLRLVWREAHRLAAGYAQQRAEDLVGLGWRGLIAALRVYDPRTAALSTYAVRRIRGAISDAIRLEHPLGKRGLSFQRRVAAAEDALTQQLQRHPTPEEIADACQATLQDLRKLQQRAAVASPGSIDELTDSDDDNRSTHAWLAADADTPQRVERRVDAANVNAALSELSDHHRAVVELVDVDGRTIRDASEQLGLDPKQVSRLRREGLAQLRERLRLSNAAA